MEKNKEICGIILAGGKGQRLYPMTKVVSKQLLSIYDKRMIYYSMSILMLAGIRDILLISDPDSIHLYKKLFEDGSQFGIKISYKVQPEPNGLAQAFVLGKEFIGDRNVSLVLGDNIFYGAGLTKLLMDAANSNTPTVFAYHVNNPSAYGVVEFDENGKVISIEEKPVKPKSEYAIPGIYFFTNDVVEIAENVKPSKRGEYEITDVMNAYLRDGRLHVITMQRGIAWLDSGTPQSLNDAANFVRTIEERTGLNIADLKEIATNNNWI
jgi:glucose-1-phosphate thymidylyltransferase